ncbi:MAG: ribosomal protein S18-alanine N-acetyltransferase [Tannerella sp.]|jgi:ribosomal-protein-alanine acetyltransferase|nr:ribosomal protein S18-alanine N-acetyltransferase [Tannerella sp.]
MSADINVRQALFEDLDEIMKIENAGFGADAFSRRQIAYLITQSKGKFFVAVHNNKIAGYVSFIMSRRHNTGRIYSIAVASEHRGLGVANTLMDKTIDLANKKKLRAVFLEVRTDNAAAIKLYEKKGFILSSIKHNYYHDGSPAYNMALRLQTHTNL